MIETFLLFIYTLYESFTLIIYNIDCRIVSKVYSSGFFLFWLPHLGIYCTQYSVHWTWYVEQEYDICTSYTVIVIYQLTDQSSRDVVYISNDLLWNWAHHFNQIFHYTQCTSYGVPCTINNTIWNSMRTLYAYYSR